ncbi:hypothetical protein D3C85_1549220 [compost metagenome]
MNADHPEKLGDEHQQQNTRQALHHALERLLHHLIDRVIQVHAGQLMEDKTEGRNGGGGDNRRDQRRERR